MTHTQFAWYKEAKLHTCIWQKLENVLSFRFSRSTRNRKSLDFDDAVAWFWWRINQTNSASINRRLQQEFFGCHVATMNKSMTRQRKFAKRAARWKFFANECKSSAVKFATKAPKSQLSNKPDLQCDPARWHSSDVGAQSRTGDRAYPFRFVAVLVVRVHWTIATGVGKYAPTLLSPRALCDDKNAKKPVRFHASGGGNGKVRHTKLKVRYTKLLIRSSQTLLWFVQTFSTIKIIRHRYAEVNWARAIFKDRWNLKFLT